MKPTWSDHSRISIFRLAILFGLVFVVANVGLLSLIYWQTSSYLVLRIDDSIYTMSTNFTQLSPEQVRKRVNEALEYDLRKSNLYALFNADGSKIAGNMSSVPDAIMADGKIHQFAQSAIPPYLPNYTLPANTEGLARAMITRLSNGDILIVGRDFTQLAEIKSIILRALVGSGIVILIFGLLSGFALSLQPMRRINAIRATCMRIMQGELSLRMPVSQRHDELDMLATIVNLMLDEIERLLNEVKSVSDTLAHDLRTPLTRLRLMLYRAQQQLPSDSAPHQLLDNAVTETDSLLARFRALLRISEIENRHRKSGVKSIQPHLVLAQLIELFEPLAEDAEVSLVLQMESTDDILADPDLLFEAVSNLIDNAIKFTSACGEVQLKLSQHDDGVHIDIIDSGCGIPIAEREFVLLRFHRSAQAQEKPGFGLGLSIVAAVMHLHGFNLQFQDTDVGTHLTIICPSR